MPILISGIFFFFPYLESLRWLRGSDFWKVIDLEIENTRAITEEDRPSAHHHTLWLVTTLSVLHNRNADFREHIFSPFCFLSKSYPVTFKTRDPKRASHWSFEFPSQKLARRKNLRFLIGTESLWIVTKHWGRNEILSWRDVLFLKNNNWGGSREPWSTLPRASNPYTLGLHLLASPTVLFGTLNAVEGLLSRSVEAGAWHACQKVSEASPCT